MAKSLYKMLPSILDSVPENAPTKLKNLMNPKVKYSKRFHKVV